MAYRNDQTKDPWSFQVGDKVLTNNARSGRVVRLEQDNLGKYYVVKLDDLPGEFAYDVCDLEKTAE